MYKLPPATRTLATLSVYVCMECSAVGQPGQGPRRKLLASHCPAGQQRRQHSTLQVAMLPPSRHLAQTSISIRQHIPTCSSLLPQPHSPVPRSKLHLLRSSVLPSKSSHLQESRGRECGRQLAAVNDLPAAAAAANDLPVVRQSHTATAES